MNEAALEILISKHLDGEITPAEERLLEAELERNPQVRRLLQELREVHELSQGALRGELVEAGRSPGEVFAAAAAQQGGRGGWRFRVGGLRGAAKFAVGAAAGFLVGWAAFAVFQRSSPAPDPAPAGEGTSTLAERRDEQASFDAGGGEQNRPRPLKAEPAGVLPYYFSYGDPAGGEWLLEAYPGNEVQPAAYQGDL